MLLSSMTFIFQEVYVKVAFFFDPDETLSIQTFTLSKMNADIPKSPKWHLNKYKLLIKKIFRSII